jgi:hypothetical protein
MRYSPKYLLLSQPSFFRGRYLMPSGLIRDKLAHRFGYFAANPAATAPPKS